MNLQKMMQQAQQMQQKLAKMQQDLEITSFEGTAGGGAVKLTVTGKRQLTAVNIDASLLKTEEKEVLEDLIVAAFSDASGKIDEVFNKNMSEFNSGLNLPPGLKLPF